MFYCFGFTLLNHDRKSAGISYIHMSECIGRGSADKKSSSLYGIKIECKAADGNKSGLKFSV